MTGEASGKPDEAGKGSARASARHAKNAPAIRPSRPYQGQHRPPARGTGFRGIFALAEFRALWAAQFLSVAGDQFARVALTVLVYERTRSPLLAAAAYAATIAPLFVGGVLLSGLADRWPRRAVMIACDLARVPLTALMAVPELNTVELIGLLCAVTAIGAPFGSARAAIYPDILGDAYPLGTAVTMATYQAAQVLGSSPLARWWPSRGREQRCSPTPGPSSFLRWLSLSGFADGRHPDRPARTARPTAGSREHSG